jgi:hypothetical protein
MRICINGKAVTLAPGMTVRAALIQSGLLGEIQKGARIFDAWDHEIGLDGALEEGSRIKVAHTPGSNPARVKNKETKAS